MIAEGGFSRSPYKDEKTVVFDTVVTLKGALSAESEAQLEKLADELMK